MGDERAYSGVIKVRIITPQMVTDLRDISGSGLTECKKALEKYDGDMLLATGYLKYKGCAISCNCGSKESKEKWVDEMVRSWKESKIKMDKPTLTIMCGIARSGKSTWINDNRKDSVVICPDKVRSEIFGHQFFANAEDFIWGVTKAMARIILEQGKDVLIDATHITFGSRSTWVKIAEQYNANFEIVWIKTSMAECIRRNESSEEGKKLPEGVIEKMAINFEDPYYDMRDEGIDITLIEFPDNTKRQENGDVFSNYYQNEVVKNRQ